MKSYKQMAADVLHRAEVCTARKKRNQRIAVTAAAFGCLSVLIAVNIIKTVMGTTGAALFVEQPTVQIGSQATEGSKPTEGNQLQVQPSIPSSGEKLPSDKEQQNFDVVLLGASSPNDPGRELVENLTLPMNYFLRVRDLRGLDSAERDLAINEERTINDQIWDEGLGSANWKRINGLVRGDYMISFVRVNQFRLKIENFDLVESISIRCDTRYGELDVEYCDKIATNWWEVELLPEDVSDFHRENGLCISWDYTNALLEELDKDPSMPLSVFSDAVTFTVKFLDGTVQESRVQIAIREDGQIFTCLLGDTVTA